MRPPAKEAAFWEAALKFCVDKTLANIGPIEEASKKAGTRLYPAAASTHNVYAFEENKEWTTSFWTGMLYLASETAGSEADRKRALDAALRCIPDFRKRLDDVVYTHTHDLGFLYTLSCVAAWRLVADEDAKQHALKAADLLMNRYYEKAGIVQAWGDMNDKTQQGRIIIDCAMNLPLLYWASEVTGNMHYHEAASSHIAQADKYLIRDDWSTYHTFYFDPDTGKPRFGKTAQGFSDDSCWSRGQAWGVYGNALSYRYLHDARLLEAARGVAHYFLNRLPDDLIAYWDLIFTGDKDVCCDTLRAAGKPPIKVSLGAEPRDSSAAAILVCGLLELANELPAGDRDKYIFNNAALHICASLADNYTTEKVPQSNGLLLHGVYSKPGKNGVDECNIWGDYFYMEALVRITRAWRPYW
jgi:unsaturated chondroitin disaccharide hydrolase